MKLAKFLSVFFAVVAVALIVATAIGYVCFHQTPPMIQTPVEEAEVRTEMLMDALCRGDFVAAGESLYGNPELQWDRETSTKLGELLWQAYSTTMSYEFTGPCYATGSGIFRDATVTVLDVEALRPKIQGQFLLLMDPHLAEAQFDSEAFDAKGALRPEFAEEMLREAVELVLQKDNARTSHQITLELVCENGQWWVVPKRSLVNIVAGVVTQ
jgi:hypothetical protein